MGKQTVSVTITPEREFFLNAEPVKFELLESQLKQLLAGQETPGIILHADKKVPIEDAVKIMDIANKNKYQLVIATKNN